MSRRLDNRRSAFISLGDALGKFSKENHLDIKLQSAKVSEMFRTMLPESSKGYLGKIDFSNGILRAQINSAPLRSDLQLAAAALTDMLNEKLNATIVQKIVLY